MLKHSQEKLIKNEREFTLMQMQLDKMEILLQQEVLVYKHKKILVDKKLNTMKKKYLIALSALRLVDFLENNDCDEPLLNVIHVKALKDIEKNGIHQQTKLQLKSDFYNFTINSFKKN